MHKFWIAAFITATMLPGRPSFAQAPTGYSYRKILTVVTNENGMRTNLGLVHIGANVVDPPTIPLVNRLSFKARGRLEVNQLDQPSASQVTLIDRNGFQAAQRVFTVQPDEVFQVNDVIGSLGAPTGSYSVNVWSDKPLNV